LDLGLRLRWQGSNGSGECQAENGQFHLVSKKSVRLHRSHDSFI
jgi:hypothetical protein